MLIQLDIRIRLEISGYGLCVQSSVLDSNYGPCVKPPLNAKQCDPVRNCLYALNRLVSLVSVLIKNAVHKHKFRFIAEISKLENT